MNVRQSHSGARMARRPSTNDDTPRCPPARRWRRGTLPGKRWSSRTTATMAAHADPDNVGLPQPMPLAAARPGSRQSLVRAGQTIRRYPVAVKTVRYPDRKVHGRRPFPGSARRAAPGRCGRWIGRRRNPSPRRRPRRHPSLDGTKTNSPGSRPRPKTTRLGALRVRGRASGWRRARRCPSASAV